MIRRSGVLMLIAAGISTAHAQPLTPGQKQAVLLTLQSQMLATTVARSVDPKVTPAKPTKDEIGKLFGQLVSGLQLAIKAGTCAAAAGSVSGASCQWAYSDSVSYSAPGSNPSWSTRTTNMNITDPHAVALNDIVGLVNLTLTATDDPKVGTAYSGGGQLLSQTLGAIPVEYSGNAFFDTQMRGNLQVQTDMTFPGFKASLLILETTGVGAPKIYYYLNGDQLTPAEVTLITLPLLQPLPKSTKPQLHASPFLN